MSIRALRRDVRDLQRLIRERLPAPVTVAHGPAGGAAESEENENLREEIALLEEECERLRAAQPAADWPGGKTAEQVIEDVREHACELEIQVLDLLEAADTVIERRADMDPHQRIDGRFTDAVNELQKVRNRIKRERQAGKPPPSED